MFFVEGAMYVDELFITAVPNSYQQYGPMSYTEAITKMQKILIEMSDQNPHFKIVPAE